MYISLTITAYVVLWNTHSRIWNWLQGWLLRENEITVLTREWLNIFDHFAHHPFSLRGNKWNLLCNNSLVRFNSSFGDTVAAAPVPDFCVFTLLFFPIFQLKQINEHTITNYWEIKHSIDEQTGRQTKFFPLLILNTRVRQTVPEDMETMKSGGTTRLLLSP